MAFRCTYCGGNNLRADRALAGRLVCGECGRPVVKNYFVKFNVNSGRGSLLRYFMIAVFVIFLILFLFK